MAETFQLSGVMMLDSTVDSEAEAERIVRLAEQKFAGNPGQVMFVIRDGGEQNDNSRFIPIASQNEGDWQEMCIRDSLSTMNRTHLEGAAEALAAQQGYAFHTGPEDGMAHTVRSYPAAWLAPLELHAVEGCGHGRATYDMTLHLLSSGARLSPTERRAALARMEEQLLEIFAALSLDERGLAVEGLSVRPRAFALTPHGEISQTAAARIVTFF